MHQGEKFSQSGVGAEGLGIILPVDFCMADDAEAEGFADRRGERELDFELHFVVVFFNCLVDEVDEVGAVDGEADGTFEGTPIGGDFEFGLAAGGDVEFFGVGGEGEAIKWLDIKLIEHARAGLPDELFDDEEVSAVLFDRGKERGFVGCVAF